MKNRIYLLALFGLALLVIASCDTKPKYKPNSVLNAEQQQELLYKMMPFIAKMPRGADRHTRFESRFAEHYRKQSVTYKFQKLYTNPADSFLYFLVDRDAPSLHKKRVAIMGKLLYKDGKISAYREFFHTYKMKEDKLLEKCDILWEHWIKNGNVNQYLPFNTEEEWVEFPDQQNYYDTIQQRWRMVNEQDSVIYL